MSIFSIVGNSGGSPGSTYYISPFGNDGSGNGSIDRPMKTFNGLNILFSELEVQPTATTPFSVMISPGVYYEAGHSGVFYPNCHYFGGSFELVQVQCDTPITIYQGSTATDLMNNAETILGISDILSSSDFNFDIYAQYQDNGLGNTLLLNGVNLGGVLTYSSRGIIDYLYGFSNCEFLGVLNISDASSFTVWNNNIFRSNVNFNSTHYTCGGTLTGNIFNAQFNVTESGSHSIAITMAGNVSNGTWSINGATTTITSDVVSLPSVAHITLTNGAVITRSSIATSLSYTPADATFYSTSPAPQQAQAALDDLSIRNSAFAPKVITLGLNLVPQGSYIVSASGVISLNLPSSIEVGQKIEVYGYSGGWQILCGGGQVISLGQFSSSTGIGSTSNTDSVELYCIVTNTIFIAYPKFGGTIEVL